MRCSLGQEQHAVFGVACVGGADNIVRDMIGFVAQRLMELDVGNRCGAARSERSNDRTNSRNGYRDAIGHASRHGGSVRLPKLRTGSYFPPFLEPRRTTEKALPAFLIECSLMVRLVSQILCE